MTPASVLLLLVSAAPATEPLPVEPQAAATTVPPRPLAAATILRSAVAIEPGQRLPVTPGAEVVVDPQATFELELSVRAPDARLVLVDARDDLVPAQGGRELSTGTRLTLAPSAPLVPGSRYTLRLDGASQRELHDEGGRAFSPATFPILAAGTPPPPEPKRPARKRKRR